MILKWWLLQKQDKEDKEMHVYAVCNSLTWGKFSPIHKFPPTTFLLKVKNEDDWFLCEGFSFST